jgi:hypothetical protein
VFEFVRFFALAAAFMVAVTFAVAVVMVKCIQAILTLTLRAVAYRNGSQAKDRQGFR